MNIPWLVKPSDEEVVANARKRMNAARKGRWLLLLYAASIAGYAILIAPKVFDLMEWQASVAGGQWQTFWAGVSAGVSMGTLYLGIWLAAFYCVGLFLCSFWFDRRDHLLVQYHDELRNRRS
jgi:hypothetical protein